MEVRASRTSSSLKGLIMAMTIFMDSIPACARFLHSRSAGGFTEPDPKSVLRGHSRDSRIKRRARCRTEAYLADSMNEFLRLWQRGGWPRGGWPKRPARD